MSPQEIDKIIHTVIRLNDKDLIRVMLAAAIQLDKRKERYALEAATPYKKAKHDTGNHRKAQVQSPKAVR